jgi:hypothetical protein
MPYTNTDAENKAVERYVLERAASAGISGVHPHNLHKLLTLFRDDILEMMANDLCVSVEGVKFDEAYAMFMAAFTDGVITYGDSK